MRERWMRWIDFWIFESYDIRLINLAVYRVLYASYVLLTYVPLATWLPDAPRAFFSPPLSLAALFPTFPPTSLLIALNVLLAFFLSLLLIGWYTRVASVGTSLALLVLRSWAYSLGKIDHDILLVITPLVLAFSGWGNAVSLDAIRQPGHRPDTPRGSWNLALLAFVIGSAMFTAGWIKVSSGWLNPSIRATYGHLLTNYFVTGRYTWLAEQSLGIDSFWLWKSADWFTVALELGFVCAMFRRQTLRIFIALACLFHCGVWLLFDIVFVCNVIAYGAFVSYVDFPPAQRLGGIAGRAFVFFRQTPAWAVLLATFLLPLTAIVTGRPLHALLRLPVDRVVILAGAVIGGGYLVRLAYATLLQRLQIGWSEEKRAARRTAMLE
jgi:Vitamin K-dependent gamma-carboxylase